MARWLWCFGPPNVVRQSPRRDDGQTAENWHGRKQQAPGTVQLQAAGSKAQKHVLFEPGGGQGASGTRETLQADMETKRCRPTGSIVLVVAAESDAAATDASAALSQQLMAALKTSRDMRINTDLHGSSHSSITGYGWNGIGVGNLGPISPKVPDDDPIQQAVLHDQSGNEAFYMPSICTATSRALLHDPTVLGVAEVSHSPIAYYLHDCAAV